MRVVVTVPVPESIVLQPQGASIISANVRNDVFFQYENDGEFPYLYAAMNTQNKLNTYPLPERISDWEVTKERIEIAFLV